MNSFKQRFRTKKKVAEGQFGTVYEVEEKTSRKTYALKQICFNDKTKPTIEREIAIQSRFDHPNLVKLEGMQIEAPYAYILTELCKYDLRTFIQNSIFPLNSQVKRSLVKDILEGLEALHREGIYHRDLKPGNILLSQDFTAKICDFGSAISESDRANGRFGIEGFTMWYKAPELLMGERGYGAEIDIWSLGCVVAELVQGAPLFPCGSEFELLGKIVSLLGQPTCENWPELEKMPNFGKVNFLPRLSARWEEVFPYAAGFEIDFLKRCIKYGSRPSAKSLLSHELIFRCESAKPPPRLFENFARPPKDNYLTIFNSAFC